MAMAQPWVDGGYRVIMVDPQHDATWDDGKVFRMSGTIIDVVDELGGAIRSGRIAFVAGFPPCTDVAVSGARWFEHKRRADPYFQAKAAIVAEQCRMVGALSGAPWFWENPVSVFSSIFGHADHWFHPCHFTAFCAEDNYTKKTLLRTGGGFVMPAKAIDTTLPPPSATYIHHMAPSDDRANLRSATPKGFARAVYEANAPHLKLASAATSVAA
jgi:hypothetical protein